MDAGVGTATAPASSQQPNPTKKRGNHMTNHTISAEQKLAADRQYLAEAAPLPTAEELAEPFVRGIFKLHEAFGYRAETMLFDLEKGEYLAEARQLVDTVERVASIVRSALLNCMTGYHNAAPLNIDDVIRSVANSYYVESVLNREVTDRIPCNVI